MQGMMVIFTAVDLVNIVGLLQKYVSFQYIKHIFSFGVYFDITVYILQVFQICSELTYERLFDDTICVCIRCVP